MKDVHYYTRPSKKKGEASIFLYFDFEGETIRITVNEKINPKFWNSSSQLANEIRGTGNADLNKRLEQIRGKVHEIILTAQLSSEIIPATEIKEKIQRYLRKEPELKKPKMTLFKFIDEFIEDSIGGTKKPGTIQTYRATLAHLQAFAKATHYKLDFDTITLSFYDKFLKFLISTQNHSNNTAGKYIKTLKTFLQEATERGYNSNVDFKKRKFATLKEDSDNIYLNDKELEAIYQLDLTNSLHLDRVRDLFLIGCNTGLRFSDFSRIKKEDIDILKSRIQIRTLKTDKKVSIPLRTQAIEILKKYDYVLPPCLSNQKMNGQLKVIGRLAKIDNEVQTRVKKGSEIIRTTFKMYQKITTHTARRSFATNAHLAGVPAITIMEMTGHQTEKSFMKYIKMTAEDNARAAQEHPYFKPHKSNLKVVAGSKVREKNEQLLRDAILREEFKVVKFNENR